MSLFTAACAPRRSRVVLCLLALTVFSAGCSSKYGAQTTKVSHYPDCYQPIADLRKSEHAVAKSTAGGAAAGAVIGAIGGYLLTGKASGAAIGAAAGAAVGGTAGYAAGSAEQEREDSARLAEYVSQIDGDISNLDRATAAAKFSRQCYDRQFTVAVSEFKAGRMTKEQFRDRYTEVASGMDEAARIVGQVSNENAQVAAQYRQALDQEAGRMGVPKEQLAQKPAPSKPNTSTASRKTPAPATKTAPVSAKLDTPEGQPLNKLAEKTTTMDTSVADAKAEEAALRERLASMNQQSQDLMS